MFVLGAVNIVTNGRVAWLINTWILDWTLDLFDNLRLHHLGFQFTLALSPIHTITLYSLSLLHTSLQSVCSPLYTHWVLLVCCPSLFLAYGLPTADVPFPGFSKCPLHKATATLFLLQSDICNLHVVWRPSWREGGSVIYSYNFLSLSGPSYAELMTTSYCLIWDSSDLGGGGAGLCIYIPPEPGGPVTSPATGFPFYRLLLLSGSWIWSSSCGRQSVDQ
jgi:hypothetical protein